MKILTYEIVQIDVVEDKECIKHIHNKRKESPAGWGHGGIPHCCGLFDYGEMLVG